MSEINIKSMTGHWSVEFLCKSVDCLELPQIELLVPKLFTSDKTRIHATHNLHTYVHSFINTYRQLL